MKKILFLGVALVAVFAFSGAGQAEANSTYYYVPTTYQPTTPTYTYGGKQMNEEQLITVLKQMIAQLQAQIDAKKGSSYGGGYYNPGYNYGYGYVIGEPRGDSRRGDDDEPEAETDSADNIEKNEAELRGSVEMNDFEDGEVFFVYGEDEDMIEDVEDDFDSYSDVDEDGDDLQKVRVDSSLDDDDDYEERVTGLDAETDYYFTSCVGYEDEDDDEVLACGDVEDFTTDKN